MSRSVLIVGLVLFTLAPATAPGAGAPVAIDIPSGGVVMKGRFFAARADGPRTTIVMVPGWPGNPDDVLGLGAVLVEDGINVLVFNPRGMHQSGGTFTFANALADIGAALDWVRSPEIARRFRVDTSTLALGGYSFGGGMAMAYAARDPTVRRVVSIAGVDHAELVRELDRDPARAATFVAMLRSTQAPKGPVRFDIEGTTRELREGMQIYGLREIAPRLADRSILMLGGWEDEQVVVEDTLVPVYRTLRRAGARDVTFLVYPDGHGFSSSRAKIAAANREWLARPHAPPPG